MGTGRLTEADVYDVINLLEEIKENRLNTWKENKNPYDILADNNRIERLGGWDFLFIADELFTDCVQVDWGSLLINVRKSSL